MKCNTCGNENVDGARFCATCGAVLAVAEPVENTLVGQVVGGRYHVKRVLGEGGMGIVYEAEQQMGNAVRKVALKTLHAHLSHDPSVSQRFHRECGTIAQLEHPNTIRVYDFGATADGTLYIAMEFVAGKALTAAIEEGPMDPARVVKIVRQIAGSLDEAHAQGVIHRDLKPDNVVLTQRAGEKDVVKLLDFGIAARTESADAQREQKLTQQGMVLGTPPYMSPEQFTGKALDARSDIYSLGVMVYEMLTGRLPFNADTPWQWATEHMTAKPIPFELTPVASKIPEQMRAAVLRALSKNKEDRQSSAAQFTDELADGVPGVTTGPHPVVAPGASTGTAAMLAPPVFGGSGGGGGPAKTAAMPSPLASGPSSPNIAPAQYAPIPPPKSGGNKGLVMGLAGVGAVLVVGIVVVATRSKSSDQPIAAPTAASTPAAATIAPVVNTPPPTTVAADPLPAPTPATPEPATGTPSTHHAATPEPTGHAAEPTPTVQRPPDPVQRPVEKPKPPAPAGCGGCIAAAQAGNLAGAAASYSSCADAAQKAQCASIVRGRASAAVQQDAFNGNCAQARASAAAAESMGVPARTFAKAMAACK
jgi:tRNA A-37 threonylcarbamoyl transferase component Bud32